MNVKMINKYAEPVLHYGMLILSGALFVGLGFEIKSELVDPYSCGRYSGQHISLKLKNKVLYKYPECNHSSIVEIVDRGERIKLVDFNGENSINFSIDQVCVYIDDSEKCCNKPEQSTKGLCAVIYDYGVSVYEENKRLFPELQHLFF